jgi:transposase
MAMGTRAKREKQQELWIPSSAIVTTPGHSFYERLNSILEAHGFDRKVEQLCRRYYKAPYGRPSLEPGVYFRMLLIGYMEGLDSERGIAWRAADSLSLRKFLGYGLEEETPDHSTLSRTRRLYAVETHGAVFQWVLKILQQEGLIEGKRIAIDATTLEANAALKNIVHRETGEKYEQYLKRLAQAAGMEQPTREQLARLDRKRKKKGSNKEWKSRSDEDARITKMKDGRTHLAHKAEHAVDLSTGALLSLTLHAADQGDTTTLGKTLAEAQKVARQSNGEGVQEAALDKGYYSGAALKKLQGKKIRSYIPEREYKHRHWRGAGKKLEQKLVYANRCRMRRSKGKRLQKLRTELAERSFAHLYESGGMRRVHLRGRKNILKRLLLQGSGFNLSLVLRKVLGAGKPRQFQDFRVVFSCFLLRAAKPWARIAGYCSALFSCYGQNQWRDCSKIAA